MRVIIALVKNFRWFYCQFSVDFLILIPYRQDYRIIIYKLPGLDFLDGNYIIIVIKIITTRKEGPFMTYEYKSHIYLAEAVLNVKDLASQTAFIIKLLV